MALQAPVLVLKDSLNRHQIQAAKAVADIIRTTLGPRSMSKILLDAGVLRRHVAENVVLVAEEQPQQVIQQEYQEPQGVLEQQQDPAQGLVDPSTKQQAEGLEDIDFCPCAKFICREADGWEVIDFCPCAKSIRREADGWEVIGPDA